MTGLLAGKTILITGASGGLGEAVTRACLEAGAEVVAVARSWRDRTGSPHLTGVAADLSTAEGCRRAVRETLARHDRLDGLAHLVGGFAGGEPLASTSEETWRRLLDLNLTPAFLIAREALPPMLAAGRGRIVAVGARAGEQPPAGLSAYSVSKAGLHALIRAIAVEGREHGVTANAVLPGIIDTPANRQAMPAAVFRRWVAPEAIAGLIVYLLSDAAGATSGALIPVYGRS